jgi:4a-hydroxytetrahydrobiopterin dehydratase
MSAESGSVPLAEQHCLPKQGELPELDSAQVEALLKQLDKWYLNSKGHLFRRLMIARYEEGIDFVQRVAQLAIDEYHHPTITLAYGTRGSYGRIGLELWTHKQGALTLNDFIVAAKIDRLWRAFGDELAKAH